MPSQYIIRARDGRLWQTSRGFHAKTIAEATKYRDQTEAQNAAAMCCQAKSGARVEEVKS
jgi:hypothetical protein